jgi:hypothetical protein
MTSTVRLDSDLIRLARVYCAGRGLKLIDYLDVLLRQRVITDHAEYQREPKPVIAAARPRPRKLRKAGR